ncbi:MAG: hypothetical protein ACREBC_09400 [Pyrinomonadaceae bacterium]
MASFRIRHRENQVTDALFDAQRAVNIMSREIANAGFNLTNNGIVAGDSDSESIRIRANLDRYDTNANANSRADVVDAGEDIKYFVNEADDTNYLVRYDNYAATIQTRKTVLANRIDSLRIHYFAQQVNYTTTPGQCDIDPLAEVTPDTAGYIVIAVCVDLPEYGKRQTAGYQPAQKILLTGDVTLRNAGLNNY